ncbi:hypothetical protein VTK73DRAFT_9665 [Phialemonium thermophilum]|uniref:DNA-directed RNA polymerase I subunit RPA34.5 n=1 Tax=Phialemonium thermophilum TaxID=223376 RepID=A0ABR3XJT4_9PEZI
MAGPKAPVGSLAQHAAQSARLARADAKPFSRSVNGTMISEKHVMVTKGDDDSDSSSESSSSDSSDDESLSKEEFVKSLKAHRKESQAKNILKSSGESKSESIKAPNGKVKSTTLNVSESESEAESSSSSESESGSSSESETEKASRPRKEAPSESKIRSADNSKDAERGGGAKVKPQAAPTGGNASITSASSDDSESSSASSTSESDEESESESDDESGDDTETESKKQNGIPQAHDATKTPKTGVAKPQSDTRATAPTAETSSSSEDEGSSSSSGSEDEADESMAIDTRRSNGDVSARTPEIIANDFQLRKAGQNIDASDVAKVFSQARMEGKQVWYFTAPASVPIEVVEKLEIPLDRAQKGLSILSHNGDDYGVAFEDAPTSRAIKLLIPNRAGDQYELVNRPVDQTMHLKRITQFSNDNQVFTTFTQSHTTTNRPGRPQPPNLKARYRPIGVPGSSPDSDEDVEMTQASLPPSSSKDMAQDPAGTSKTHKRKKRKLTTDEEAATSQPAKLPTPAKKAKKSRTEGSTPVASAKTGHVTPVLPPVVPVLNGSVSSSKAEAQPAASSQPGTSKGLPVATPGSNRKMTPVPLPTTFQPTSSQASLHHSSPTATKPKKKKRTDKKSAEESGKEEKAPQTDVASAKATPIKRTPVPPPTVPRTQRPVS